MGMGRRSVATVVRVLFVGVVALLVAYVGFLRPAHMRWGATGVEVARPMPGDSLVGDATFVATRAVTVDARPDQVWPWIVQMGTGRAGFYGYDWIDNGGAPSADRILPRYQSPQAGDLVPRSADGRTGYLVKGFAVNRYVLWTARTPQLTWCWSLYPTDDGRTRLVSRTRLRYPWASAAILGALVGDVSDAFTTRKTLLGIKARAEAAARKERGGPAAGPTTDP
jgi:hypothetical protein